MKYLILFRISDLILSKKNNLFCLLAIVVIIILPKDGIGVSTCLFKLLTGLDCPTCGLTRSMACITKFDITASIHYHPFGLIVLPAILFLALCYFLPLDKKIKILKFIYSKIENIDILSSFFLYAMVIYGIIRILHRLSII